MTVDGDSAGLPTSVERAVVRVAQEAITNATRYAPGAAIRVMVGRATGGDVAVTIDNGPRIAQGTSSVHGSGRGLIGLAERLRLLGGSFGAGPRTDGGWRVEGYIPVTRTEMIDTGRERT